MWGGLYSRLQSRPGHPGAGGQKETSLLGVELGGGAWSAGLGGPELAGEDTGRAWADCRAYRMPGAEARDVSPVVCVEVNYESKIKWPAV